MQRQTMGVDSSEVLSARGLRSDLYASVSKLPCQENLYRWFYREVKKTVHEELKLQEAKPNQTKK